MFVCGVPRNSAEFQCYLNLEHSLFGRLSVPTETAQTFFRLRPEIYQVVIAPGDVVAAYSSAYPLQPKWAQALIAGEIAEPDLTPSMLLRRDESLEGSTFYIGSVVVANGYDRLTKLKLLASLISWRARQFEAACINRLRVILTPVTEEGERMARQGGARLLNDGTGRKDGYPVCGRDITRGFLTGVATALERCLDSSIVEMNYNF